MTRNSIILSLYIAIFICIAMALWNPKLSLKKADAQLTVLVDNSNSVGAAAWQDFQKNIRPVLETQYDEVNALFFSNTVAGQAEANTNKSTTNIAQALSYVDQGLSKDKQNNIFIVSDFGETTGNSLDVLKQLKSKHIPVFIHRVAKDLPDVWLKLLPTSNVARVGEKIEIPVQISSTLDTDLVVELELDGKRIADHAYSISSGEIIQHVFQFSVTHSGAHFFTLTLHAEGDEVPENNQATMMLNVNSGASVLYVGNFIQSDMVNLLKMSGVEIEQIRPQQFSSMVKKLSSFSSVILDNIHQQDLDRSHWQAIKQAVKGHGLSLLVSGGDRSYSIGGYRRSKIEEILPLISEPGKEEQTTAFMFLIDKSGSMGLEPSGLDRTVLAKQAVMNTTKVINKGDYLGVMAFDTKVSEYLKLGKYANPVNAVRENWLWSPKGGTLLRPALEAAIEQLSQIDTHQKILVVLTDGFVEKNEFPGIKQALKNNGITLQIIAIGNELEKQALTMLAHEIGATLNTASDILTLPTLMRSQVEKLRLPMRVGSFSPVQQDSFPFNYYVSPIPSLKQYTLTRAKKTASVILEARNGDPLLAYQYYGIGLVVSLPFNINHWLANWKDNNSKKAFISNFIGWLSGQDNSNEYMYISQSNTNVNIIIDELDSQMSWLSEPKLVKVSYPDGKIESVQPQWKAPGRIQLDIPLSKPGIYSLSIRNNAQFKRLAFVHDANIEYLSVKNAKQTINKWQALGLVRNWNGNAVDYLESELIESDSRPWFLVLGLSLYLILMFTERGLWYYWGNIWRSIFRKKGGKSWQQQ